MDIFYRPVESLFHYIHSLLMCNASTNRLNFLCSWQISALDLFLVVFVNAIITFWNAAYMVNHHNWETLLSCPYCLQLKNLLCKLQRLRKNMLNSAADCTGMPIFVCRTWQIFVGQNHCRFHKFLLIDFGGYRQILADLQKLQSCYPVYCVSNEWA